MAPLDKSARCSPVAAGIVIILLGLFWYVTALFGLRTLVFNPTTSAPPGFHVRVETATLDTVPGYSGPDYHRLVAFPVPTAVANWTARRYSRQRPAGFLKPVFGLPGDEICFVPGQGYFRNRVRFSDPLPTATEDGMLLPAWTGCQMLGPDEIFVYSARIPNSFDSRSFGPVPTGALIGVYDPLLTW